ncbi:MAG: NusG domain II-containing protein [Candidatus Sulfobium sp.]
MKKIIRSTTVADRLLFLVLLIGSVAGIFIARDALPQATGVVIDVAGKPAYNFPIDVNRTVTLHGPYGKMVVEIRDRKVRMKEAHCPNLLCVKEGWISKGVIVCLPNKVVITVGGGTAGPKGVDAITR